MCLNIYQIGFDFTYALADVSEQRGLANSLDLYDDTPELIRAFEYKWVTEDAIRLPKLILIMSKLLGISADSYPKIKSAVHGLETVDIDIQGERYKIFVDLPVVKNGLNLHKSKITRFSTGDIMHIDSPVFLPMDYPPLFKIAEESAIFFCSSELYNEIVSNKLSGWLFHSCPIKSKSWFNF